MKEQNPLIANKILSVIGSELRPWGILDEKDLVKIVPTLSISVLALARRSKVSVERVLGNLPVNICVNKTVFTVSLDGHNTRIPIKKLIRESVKEPPIRGVRNGGKSLDERVLGIKNRQAKKERETVTFTLFDKESFERNGKKSRKPTPKSTIEGNEHNNNRSFMPEKLIVENGELCNPQMISIETSIDDVMGLIPQDALFPRISQEKTIETTIKNFLITVSPKIPTDELITRIIHGKQRGLVSFGIMCLPCLNPNPFITDHPSKVINIPTVIFLERLNNIATELENLLKIPVRFNLARELEHMGIIFNMADNVLRQAIDDLNKLLLKRNLTRIQICKFPISETINEDVSLQEANKFFPAFKRSQVASDLDPIVVMRWLGVINKQDALRAAKRKGIDLEEQLQRTKQMEKKAFQQAMMWARIRESPWQTTGGMNGSIIISIRPGSENFTIIPVTPNATDKLPMLPQHCAVGLKKDNGLITMKRVEFLLHPKKWVEVKTEYGSMFIDSSLL